MITNNNVSPIQAVRFIVSIPGGDENNTTSYNTKLDGSNKMPSAYMQAIMTAKAYKGIVSGDLGDGNLFHIKSFT